MPQISTTFSWNHDLVTQDNPQTLLWVVSHRNYFLCHGAQWSLQSAHGQEANACDTGFDFWTETLLYFWMYFYWHVKHNIPRAILLSGNGWNCFLFAKSKNLFIFQHYTTCILSPVVVEHTDPPFFRKSQPLLPPEAISSSSLSEWHLWVEVAVCGCQIRWIRRVCWTSSYLNSWTGAITTVDLRAC